MATAGQLAVTESVRRQENSMLIRQIYLYSVCLVSLVVGTIHVGILVYDIFEFTAPEMMLTSSHNTNPTSAEYRNAIRHLYDHSKDSIPAFEEYSEQTQREYDHAINLERRNAMQSAIRACITIAICLLLFAIHWRFGKKVEVT